MIALLVAWFSWLFFSGWFLEMVVKVLFVG